MAKYAVTITETLSRTLIVEATDFDEACGKIERAYNAAEIVLDAEDYFDTDISAEPCNEWEHMFCEEWKED